MVDKERGRGGLATTRKFGRTMYYPQIKRRHVIQSRFPFTYMHETSSVEAYLYLLETPVIFGSFVHLWFKHRCLAGVNDVSNERLTKHFFLVFVSPPPPPPPFFFLLFFFKYLIVSCGTFISACTRPGYCLLSSSCQ